MGSAGAPPVGAARVGPCIGGWAARAAGRCRVLVTLALDGWAEPVCRTRSQRMAAWRFLGEGAQGEVLEGGRRFRQKVGARRCLPEWGPYAL